MAIEPGAVQAGVMTRVLRMTGSRRAGAMAGTRYVGRRGCRQGGSTLAVGCGNPLTYRRNTRPLPESPFFADSSVLHASRATAVPQKVARHVVGAPQFDVPVWHRSCVLSSAEGQSVRHDRSSEQGAGRDRKSVV